MGNRIVCKEGASKQIPKNKKEKVFTYSGGKDRKEANQRE